MSKLSGRYDAGAGPLPVGIWPKFGRSATRRLRLAWIGLVGAGLAIVCSSAGAQTWGLGQDLLAHTNATRENFNRFSDSHGNPDVWHLMAASSLARDPSTYARIDLYRRDQCVAGLDYWGALGRLFGGDLGINTNATELNACGAQVVPAHEPLAHPDPDNVVLYGWKSPITGTVTISGEISDADGGCGNGVDWFVAHGSTDIASGSIANGGAQAFPAGLAATVVAGDFLYFIIDPKDGNHSCDLTVVDVTIAAGAQTWDLGQDLLAHTNATRENFNRFSDSDGNPGVWHLMAASSLARNPSTYARIDLYRRDQCVAGLDYWGALGRPFGGDLGINTNANLISCVTQVIPEHRPLAHPDPDNVVLYGWKSPITGTVTISGEISDADGGCGNGVAWYVAHGSTDIASGAIANGGMQAFPAGLAATVVAGDFLYFIIDPKDGNHSCDLTVVDVTIASTAADRDGDGVEDGVDNCPDTANPGQENADQDELGDVCDPDDDNDGVEDDPDNCELTANPGQEDTDQDGQGDACDPDDDNDGIADGADNCPDAANPAQENNDGDGQGNVCDAYTFGFFRPPVDNPPVVNTGRAGRTYPIKFRIFDAAGNYVTSLSAVTSIKYKAVFCGAFASDPTDALETTAAGATELRYDPVENQFVYNWKTPANAGCYELFVTLADGGVHSANFNLR